MNDTMTTAKIATYAAIEADPTVPIIRITRDFAATPAQLFRAHTDPELKNEIKPTGKPQHGGKIR